MDYYCNNCGRKGHLYNQCKLPITSVGIIAFRWFDNKIQYLLIRRKDTLGFIDFMRGKYSIYNKKYIKNMVYQMSQEEINLIKCKTFDELWTRIWGIQSVSNQYKNEENNSKEKFNMLKQGINNSTESYSLNSIIDEVKVHWTEPEWGFPKGRRNFQEKDYECAVREFCEETGFNKSSFNIIKNIFPYEENFTGSNYKSYKHKYYVAYMKVDNNNNMNNFQRSEVGCMEWKTYDESMKCIRSYNLEKKRVLCNINNTILHLPLANIYYK